MRRSRHQLLAAVLLVLHPLAAIAEQKATIEEILDGPELYIDRNQARLNQKARAPQTISTGNSRGQIRFNTGASGRINRDSLMRLGQSCFLLSQGQVLISGKQSACTRSTRLSVRGTHFLVDVNEDEDTQLSVLEGDVDLELLRDGKPISKTLSRLKAGQRLQFSASSGALRLTPLRREDYAAILNGPLFRDFRAPLAEEQRLEQFLRQTYPELLPLMDPAADDDLDRNGPMGPQMPYPQPVPYPEPEPEPYPVPRPYPPRRPYPPQMPYPQPVPEGEWNTDKERKPDRDRRPNKERKPDRDRRPNKERKPDRDLIPIRDRNPNKDLMPDRNQKPKRDRKPNKERKPDRDLMPEQRPDGGE
ncbi:MAG: FecR domain-containing protein [Synechococcaceae cyanobacterium]|nr:FecR domain-containing protein [Synechococcaceae cyanobacterium]